jgi:hypothetical protein
VLVGIPAALQFALVARASPAAPLLDDYDALLAFAVRWLDHPSPRVRLHLVFAPHNEHVIAVTRALALIVWSARGYVDLLVLNLLGNALALLWLAGLFAAFRTADPAGARLLAFAPAALVALQPQAWMAALSPMVSISNLGVLAFAAVACAAADRGSRRADALAAAAALAALLSQGNGALVPPLLALVAWLRGRRRAALGWLLASAALLLPFSALLLEPDPTRASPLASLARPDRLARYALHLAGCAAGFGNRGAAPWAGLLLLAGALALLRLGLARRSPPQAALLVFLLGSIAANALVRAHQGAAAPLFQSHYRLYGAALLALVYLGGAELARARAARACLAGARLRSASPRCARASRAYVAGGLATGLAFSLASFRIGSAEALEHSGRVAEGLERWWTTGEGGLLHPDARKARFYLLAALDRGLLRIPPDWVERLATAPEPRTLPESNRAARAHLDAVYQDRDAILVAGWAQTGGSDAGQPVELVLASVDRAFAAPARSVPRAYAASAPGGAGRRGAGPGFHALVDARRLPPGRYRVGALVQRAGIVRPAWSDRTVTVPPARGAAKPAG